MRILVTGATGFIGHSLVPVLRERGHEVTEMVRYVAGRFDSYGSPTKVFADLREDHSVREAVRMSQPEAIIHLAAMSAVAYSFAHQSEVTDVVFGGTLRLVEAARAFGVQHFISASSSEVYGGVINESDLPIKESHPLHAASPYGVAKIAADEYLNMVRRVYAFPITIVRPFNTYGRALVGNRHFVVERAITQALIDGVIRLHNPLPQREFVFRDDHVSAYVRVVEQRDISQGKVYNVCRGFAYTIDDMVSKVSRLVSEATGKPRCRIIFEATPDRPRDIDVLLGDNTLIRKELGWTPTYDLEMGLRKAITEWRQVLQK